MGIDFLENPDGVVLVAVDHFSVQFKDRCGKKTLRIVGKVDFSEKHPFVKTLQRLKRAAITQCVIPFQVCLHLITQVREMTIERYKDKPSSMMMWFIRLHALLT